MAVWSLPTKEVPSWNVAVNKFLETKIFGRWGSGCGAVVHRVVASTARGTRFESSHIQKYLLSTLLKDVLKTTIKNKQAGD